MIYQHCITMIQYTEPEYDLEIFYENPTLAKPLIEKMENDKYEKHEKHKQQIKENYEENSTSQGKTFNWAVKTYK